MYAPRTVHCYDNTRVRSILAQNAFVQILPEIDIDQPSMPPPPHVAPITRQKYHHVLVLVDPSKRECALGLSNSQVHLTVTMARAPPQDTDELLAAPLVGDIARRLVSAVEPGSNPQDVVPPIATIPGLPLRLPTLLPIPNFARLYFR